MNKTLIASLLALTGTAQAHVVLEQKEAEADQLQDVWYDEFELLAGPPEQPGEPWFEVRQACAVGESNWAEVPAAGSATKGLKLRAARRLTTPASRR